MRVSYGWLKQYVDVELGPRQVADRLTMAGLEVEGLERQGDDWAMEINVTPNRPDCLSVFGIAREVAALTKKPLRPPAPSLDESSEETGKLVRVSVEAPSLCPRYAGRVIRGVKVGPSPGWLRERLESVGVRPINNVVDVTNFVMMELGQPLHAFDYGALGGRRVIVRQAVGGEAFTTLDEVERRLSPGMLLICDGKEPVAVAGVMGGLGSGVGPDTADVFLESAYFSPAGVRRTAKDLGLHTESSHRFERGTDPEGVLFATDRAAGLIAEVAGGRVASGRVDEYPSPVATPEITLRTARVKEVLGADVERRKVEEILGLLHMGVAHRHAGELVVRPPSFRPDLTREIDIIEEIARVYGYGRIKSVLPVCRMSAGARDRAEEAARSVKCALRNAGYSEVINYSFINPQEFDRLMLPEDDPARSVITLRNPLTVEQSVMRTTLLPSLLSNLAWNVSRGVRAVRIFELSKVFVPAGPGLPDEPLRVAALGAGPRTGSLWDGRDGTTDFFDLKGVVETLLADMRIEGAVFRPASELPFLHPGRSAWVVVGGKEAGYVGQAHPDVLAAYDLPLEACVFELKLQDLVSAAGAEPKYAPLPKFPSVERDVALIVPDEVSSFGVLKVVESLKLPLVEDVRLFDYYRGKPIPEGRKSLAYTVTYRAPERTLTDDEVNEVHGILVAALKERLGAETREQ